MPNHQASQVKISPIQAMPVAMQDIEALVAAHYPYIHRLATSILDDHHEADDAAQDTFIAACRTLDTYRGEANLKTWLTAIALNVCRSRLRKRKMRRHSGWRYDSWSLAGMVAIAAPYSGISGG